MVSNQISPSRARYCILGVRVFKRQKIPVLREARGVIVAEQYKLLLYRWPKKVTVVRANMKNPDDKWRIKLGEID